MKHDMEDRPDQFRKKIQEMDTLPEGYCPDLQSKWDILESALEKKKRPAGLIWSLSIAASVMLFIFLKNMSHEGNKREASERPHLTATNVHADTSIAMKPAQNKTYVAHQKHSGKTPKVKIQETGIIDDSLPAISQIATLPLLESPDSMITSEALPKPDLKKRYVQVDFDTPGQVLRTGKTTVASVKFKFGIRQYQSAENAESDEPALRLRQNF